MFSLEWYAPGDFKLENKSVFAKVAIGFPNCHTHTHTHTSYGHVCM